ncbi:GAF and ANTAR domain-containing protein [Gordonia soli]|uniref:ANTAR domain-containing protein n=1 Tax=Gordonia soli NBRC 108243 TaxID=1223545 RepID=M0QIX9_9ACTN|nr:GAF and ANTAR domain-containing protein [Gordonia soli]GAC68590.1 hypothetical protein GS4_16_01210 [Gordonia soli NBRC 108243]
MSPTTPSSCCRQSITPQSPSFAGRNDRTAPPPNSTRLLLPDLSRRFDALQHEHGDGPCFDAIWQQHTVRIDDFTSDTRWPALAAAVVAETPIRSTLSIQLFTAERELDALTLHSQTAASFDADLEDIATVLAAHAAIAFSAARRGQQFHSALATRDIIGQAKGMLMERYDISAFGAFDMLRRLSQETNTPVVEVAEQLVQVDHPE